MPSSRVLLLVLVSPQKVYNTTKKRREHRSNRNNSQAHLGILLHRTSESAARVYRRSAMRQLGSSMKRRMILPEKQIGHRLPTPRARREMSRH